MSNKNTQYLSRSDLLGFTLVELLVTITILATLSVIAYISTQGYMKTSYNGERRSAIASLKLSLSDYSQMRKTLPDPTSNAQYYDIKGVYAHSASWAYGVSGYVNDDTSFLPAGYVNFDATDPETKQFYAYGKTIDNTTFSLASNMYIDGAYQAYVAGTYDGANTASLIKAYSSSDFVSNESTESLPYNPYERKVVARIETWSGVVSAKSANNAALSLTGELQQWDSITVATGALAVVHVSDGSELTLGTDSGATVLELSSLSYSDDHNLATKVALFLRSGESWVKAPRLRSEPDSASDFSIQTDGALAAVRWTIFGVTSYQNSGTSHTDITVIDGKVEVMKKTAPAFTPESTLGTSLVSFSGATGSTPPLFTSTGAYINQIGHTYIQNTQDQPPARFGVDTYVSTTNHTSGTQTGTVDPTLIEKKLNFRPFIWGFRPRLHTLIGTGVNDMSHTRILIASFDNPGADWYRLSYTTTPMRNTDAGILSKSIPNKVTFSGSLDPSKDIGTASGVFMDATGAVSLELCKKRTLWEKVDFVCSAANTQGIGQTGAFAFEQLAEREDMMRPGYKKINTSCTTDDPSLPGFWKNCLTGGNSGLVAYAPYSNLDSLSGSLGMLTNWGINLLSSQGTMDYSSKYIPILNGSGSFNPANSTPQLANDEKLKLLQNSGFNFYEKFGIFSFKNEQGVYLDDLWTDTYIKYDLSPLNISGTNFAIEMRVRGGALKRASAYYILANGTGAAHSTFRLQLESWNLYVANDNSGINQLTISGSVLLSQITENNSFYTIRYEKMDGSNYKLSILKDATVIISQTKKSDIPPQLSTNDVWIWVWSSLTGQWNDIIDSVKIYRY